MFVVKHGRQSRSKSPLFSVLQASAMCAALLLAAVSAAPHASAQAVGALEGHQDVGPVLHAGHTAYDASADTYTVTGSGSNLWFTSDEMQFAWKRVHGDVALTAEIDFVGEKATTIARRP